MTSSDDLDDARVLASLGRILTDGAPYTALPGVDPTTKLPPAATVDAIRAPLEEALTELDADVVQLQPAVASLESLVEDGRLSESNLAGTIGAVVESEVATSPLIVRSSEEAHLRPLAAINKAKTGPYRIALIGNSIQNSAFGIGRLVASGLADVFGRTTTRRYQLGGLGGSYGNTINGWNKQPFGGQSFTRMKGTAASSTITSYIGGFGDEIVVEWGQESDTQPFEVFIDGVSAGTAGSSGVQRFGRRTVFTVTKGFHLVTWAAPASGAAYPEAIEFREANRRGVEILDFTLGGSLLTDAKTVHGAASGQIAGQAIAPGAGIEALYGRDDVDLIIDNFHANDAGLGGDVTATEYRELLEQAATAALAKGTPLVLLTDPAGHYAMPNDGGSSYNYNRWIAVRQHRLEVAQTFPNVTFVDWDAATRIEDIEEYAATYYPTVANLNVAAGTWNSGTGGDFIHPDGPMENSAYDIGKVLLAEAIGADGYEAQSKTFVNAQIEAFNDTSAVIHPLGPGTDNSFPRTGGTLYRSAGVTNLRPALRDLVVASGASDAHGKYYLAALYNWSFGTVAGTKMATLAIGPNDSGAIEIRVNANQVMYAPDGVTAVTAAAGTKTLSLTGIAAGTKVHIAFPVSQAVNNTFMTISGRVYDAVLADGAFPVLGATP